MRGEYSTTASRLEDLPELPPRARRIPTIAQVAGQALGTTSACAENTRNQNGQGVIPGNYLRVRGEYACPRCDAVKKWELPPRARRIRRLTLCLPWLRGTTSACAENTMRCSPSPKAAWNYLRVRGEYRLAGMSQSAWGELPPRARRILFFRHPCWGNRGTTSACAENTAVWLVMISP